MFRKPFVVKSSTNIRHSERKALLPPQISACFNSKQQFSSVKVQSQTGTVLRLFVHDKEPLFFQAPNDPTVYPSVYFLWTHPLVPFPALFVHSSVLSSLQNGSDLMIPGILLAFPSIGGDFAAGQPVAIACASDEGEFTGPVAVGRAVFGAEELRQKRLNAQKGKAVEVLHTFGDSLWEFGSKRTIPKMETIADAECTNPEKPAKEEQQSEEAEQSEAQLGNVESQEESPADETKGGLGQADMEELLHRTFFSALRWRLGPIGRLPIDAGQFYASHILRTLPPGLRLEIKKTRYKKFATFLREINNDNDGQGGWVVRVNSVKGVDSIEAVNFEHPLVADAPQLAQPDSGAATSAAVDEPFVQIHENMCSLTEQVMPLFRPLGAHKGDLVDLNRIRQVLLEYARKRNLLKPSADGRADAVVELDDTLQMCVRHFLPEQLPTNKVVQRLAGAMTRALVVRTRDGKQLVHRGKVPAVELKVEKRSGNKLVTLVSNLAAFGLDVRALDKEIRGTGTTILAQAPACEGPQLLIQGNEVNAVARLLQEHFGVTKKFIRGLELGVKEKKNKKK